MKKAHPTASVRVHKNLEDRELLRLTEVAAKTEKEATLIFLGYLAEVDERRLYAAVHARASLFEYLVKDLNFSNPAASERVNAVRLIRAVPEVKHHLESGRLTLTSAAQIQRFVNAEACGHPKKKALALEAREKIVDACLNLSSRQVEKTLFENQSESAKIFTQEKIRLITSERSEIKFTVDEDFLKSLQDLKNLVGFQSLEKIFTDAMAALLALERKKRGVIQKNGDQHVKVEVAAGAVGGLVDSNIGVRESVGGELVGGEQARDFGYDAKFSRAPDLKMGPNDEFEMVGKVKTYSRFVPMDLKRFVFARSNGQCEFEDKVTRIRCESMFRLQIDHIFPLAFGGKTDANNLRHLCSAHNLVAANDMGLKRPEFQVRT